MPVVMRLLPLLLVGCGILTWDAGSDGKHKMMMAGPGNEIVAEDQAETWLPWDDCSM